MSWEEQSVFVTGATGFIGGRVCERLVQARIPRIKALVHNPRRAARISRLPIELCPGDLLDKGSLREAMGDAKTVIHLGTGAGKAIPRGTRNLLQVADAAGVGRFVHMSSVAVFGLRPPAGHESEDAPMRRTGNSYCDNKLRAEQMVVRFRNRLPAVILRPAIVYGPFSGWGPGIVQGYREGKLVLIDEGRGICNSTYVDNLVDAIFLSLANEQAVGEAFHVTDGEALTWARFIRAFAELVESEPHLPSVSSAEILRYHRNQPGIWRSSLRETRRLLFGTEFKELIRRVPLCDRGYQRLWELAQHLSPETKQKIKQRLGGVSEAGVVKSANESRYMPDLDVCNNLTGTVTFSIDKARRILGYQPRISFERGVELTAKWLRFANYI
jgi:nucleoside-diphosphate-sugar epimerase